MREHATNRQATENLERSSHRFGAEISEKLLVQNFDPSCLFIGQGAKFLFPRPLWQMSASLSQKAAKQFDFSIWHLDNLFYRG